MLFEWFSSPIIYLETDFANQFRKIMNDYFSSKKSLYHYVSMAESNYREYLKTELVRAKKYFYVLRPLLACKWILDTQTPPPMLFSELAAAELPEYLREDVDRLLFLKMNAPEIKEIPRIDSINEYLDNSIVEIKSRISGMEDAENNWDQLNKLFLQTITKREI